MKYSLGPLPVSLATCQGSLVKSNKTKLMNFLESGFEVPPHIEAPPNESVWIIDGMALLQQIKYRGVTLTGLLADHLLRTLLPSDRSNGSKFVHFVTDSYMNNSIKNAERVKSSCGVELMKIYANEQKCP
ncbi:hypothetical protein HOLleu_24196 [Holothuria leucospilota]|uniref:Uncharacterized protein n=1 Tax=Holothuria leucospilota TaxID=206669 RepID=A0A9Q1BW47_HOLLE|nr:hypothetical protein HOLleu_24196 [Holothuria leucospilota]